MCGFLEYMSAVLSDSSERTVSPQYFNAEVDALAN